MEVSYESKSQEDATKVDSEIVKVHYARDRKE